MLLYSNIQGDNIFLGRHSNADKNLSVGFTNPTYFIFNPHLEIKDFGSPTRGEHHDLFISKKFINNLKCMTSSLPALSPSNLHLLYFFSKMYPRM